MSTPDRNQTLVDSLLRDIRDLSDGSTPVLLDGKRRAALLQASRRLAAALEQPDEVISEVALSPYRSMCARVAVDLNLFGILAHSSGPMTVDQLARESGAEKDLIDRFLRVLSDLHVVAETGKSTYAATAVTRVLSKESPPAGLRLFFDQGIPVICKMPEYFKSNGYRLPRTYSDGPLQYAHGTSLDAYHYWQQQPGVIENFHTFMKGLLGTPDRAHWTDCYDVKKFIFDQYDKGISDVVFVDVGGGNGHETQTVKEKFPAAKGRFIVQDLTGVIEQFSGSEQAVEFMAHDFLTPQPVKGFYLKPNALGAKAYFLQNILHNWATEDCVNILSHLAAAMRPGYSRLLIANIILPDRNCPSRQAKLDIAMLVLHNGSQRTEEQFSALLDKAGLEVVKFWHPAADGDGIVEARLRS